MKRIIATIRELPAFIQATNAIKENERQPCLGLARSARLPVLVALHQELDCPILLLTHRTDRALTLTDELALWSPDASVLFFPEPTALFYENVAWGENTRRERLAALTTLASTYIPGAKETKSPSVITASIRAVMARTMPRRDFIKSTHILRQGQGVGPSELIAHWVKLGYQPTTTVVAPGQFARRGGILDIWPPDEELPTRIDFFGDEIDGLRHFDPASQRTVGKHERLLVPPAREFLSPAGALNLREDEELTEFYIPLLHKQPASVLDYLPNDALVLIDDWEAIHDTVSELEGQAISLRKDYLADGSIDEGYPIPYLTLNEIEDALTDRTTLELGPATSGEGNEFASAFTPGPRFGGRLKPLMDHMGKLHNLGDGIVIASRQAVRLQELWLANTFEEREDPPPRFIQGSLSDGFTLTQPQGERWHLLTDGEIFGWTRPQIRQRPRVVTEAPEAPYIDFQINHLVVHIDHGIGRFKGLVQRKIEGIEQEYLCVEYAAGDQLYVPVHQADRLTSYIGARGHRPSLSRLGGIEWRNVKSRVKQAVEEVAEDLLRIYAQRKVSKGYAFSSDVPWQKELEASFPYIETDDQLRVIEEVKEDMEKPQPMDRLICGDVGYGKTEVALRAAFKAVMDGKQVAMLTPTTILAQQHYRTFQQRLAAFPVEVEMLSRFRTPQEQRTILHQLAQGAIDIVIGTHRLIQPDVVFKDLGLLVIDEEQRFGVTHKEYLKKLRTEVDVLTMTATPIPRTLYMALTGVRDISTINTPPEERLPIITHVGPYSQKLVRQAILRELERGGQVFFVHNRVQTIKAMSNQVKRLVPEARIAVAHGQMAEKELAKRMGEFTTGEIDVLVTTSIIESGLDIPNANTLVVDRADAFGLAQLYQLRGRVGRGAQRAYAYFFRHQQRTPTEQGRQRLETIAENTQLGAGFSIAMRDLEIRGAGDILGTRQHGHIAAVGFHLYTRLLSQAVEQLRAQGELTKDTIAASITLYHPMINVDLPLAINIPPDYVPDKSMRLRLYRRLADIREMEEIEALAEEFNDRFGPPPEPVMNMFYQLKVKLLAEKAGLAAVTVENQQVALRYPSLPENAPPRKHPAMGEGVRTSKNTIWLYQSGDPMWREKLIETLSILVAENSIPQPA